MSAIPQPMTFEKLKNRYRIKAEVVAATGLRVGAGKSLDAAATDQPVMRDALGRPYLPGSSLKGALRSALESILRGLGHSYPWACNLFEEDASCVGDSPVDKERLKKGEPIPLAEVLERSCTVCGLFGSAYLAGRLFIHDLPRLGGAPSEIRDGVGIHRDLGTAQGGVKYNVEVVPVGSRFQLEMVLENADEMQLALVLQALELLNEGVILLGGLTSRGLGRVVLEHKSIEKTTAERLLMGAGFEELDYADQLTRAKQTLTERFEAQQEEGRHA